MAPDPRGPFFLLGLAWLIDALQLVEPLALC